MNSSEFGDDASILAISCFKPPSDALLGETSKTSWRDGPAVKRMGMASDIVPVREEDFN
jgi:hypothetical protein